MRVVEDLGRGVIEEAMVRWVCKACTSEDLKIVDNQEKS